MLRIASHQRNLVIRVAAHDDGGELARLAALDSSRPLRGCVLVAEIDGVAVAAISVPEGQVVADPFERTAEIVEMLRLRVRQIVGGRPRRRLSPRPRPVRALRPVPAY
jgi:alpha-beta hydrolase superfamily lysophospholipase